MLALDVSASMDESFPDLPLSVREAASAMLTVTLNVEQYCKVRNMATVVMSLCGNEMRGVGFFFSF